MSYKRLAIIVGIINVLVSYYLYVNIFPIPEEFFFNTTEFINKHGYRSEEHRVFTESGYEVTIFRLLPKDGAVSVKPFLLLGGLFCNSDVYVMFGPGHDLAFSLVDAGYDVWLLNDRGTKYGKRMEGANNTNYLDNYSYGYHEIGVDELRVTIDYVTNKTGSKKVALSGISAGCASILVLLSNKPEYNERVSVTLHFGCGLSLNTTDLGMKMMGYSVWYMPSLVRLGRLLSYYKARTIVVHLAFMIPYMRQIFVETAGYINNNERTAHLLVTHGISENCYGIVAHLMQNRGSTEFLMRDYGTEENMRVYNSTTPQPYDVSSVVAPVKFYYSENDKIVDNNLARRIFRTLKNTIGEYSVKEPFSHVQFIANCAANKQLVSEIIETLNEASFT